MTTAALGQAFSDSGYMEIEAQPQKRLIQKLAEVMKAVHRVPKRGRNTFHNYDYATEADIVEAIRSELADRHIMLVPQIVGHERESVGEKGSYLTTLSLEFTFHDGETGETLTRGWMGAGIDKDDKGLYKAMTGGEKYFLLKTFLIPTGDDPERDDASSKQGQRGPTTRRGTSKRDLPEGVEQANGDVVNTRTGEVSEARELPQDHYYIAKSYVSKSGAKVGKDGERHPWTLYRITTTNGQEFSTFDRHVYENAERAKNENLVAEIVSEHKGERIGWSIVSLTLKDAEPLPF